MSRLRIAVPLMLLMLGGCSNASDAVPEPHDRAMLLSACQSPSKLQCVEGYMAAPEGLLRPGQRADVNVPVDSMQCPEDYTAIAACPQADRIGVYDLTFRDGIGMLRSHIYRGGESELADCERNDALRVYRL